MSNTARSTLVELETLLQEASHFSALSMVNERVRNVHDRILLCLDAASIEDTDAILGCADAISLRDSLIALNAEMHQKTEIALAQRFLASDNQEDPFEGSWVNKGFSRLLHMQLENWKASNNLSKIMSGAVVIVGGGALPQTQVFLHKQLGCKVISVDCHAESAELCRKILKKTGFSHLEVFNEDGCQFDYTGASMIVVATLVQKKAQISARVAETAPDAFFAPRMPLGLHAMWRELVPSTDFAKWGWQLLDMCAPPDSSVGSMLFVRNPAQG
ncbi:MAG: hypothetical protein U5N23_23060 [Acidovorax sp.]|nr:hypothetical protein [Acidovorax sp.]